MGWRDGRRRGDGGDEWSGGMVGGGEMVAMHGVEGWEDEGSWSREEVEVWG